MLLLGPLLRCPALPSAACYLATGPGQDTSLAAAALGRCWEATVLRCRSRCRHVCRSSGCCCCCCSQLPQALLNLYTLLPPVLDGLFAVAPC
jgi:hypothetical protein